MVCRDTASSRWSGKWISSPTTGLESKMAWDTSPVLLARLHTMDRALAAPQLPASAHERRDCPLLSWVVKDSRLATRQLE